jgi:DNA-binding MarR family transcriptional regulator
MVFNKWMDKNRFLILKEVVFINEITMKELVKKIEVTEHTIRTIINEMVELKLVKKEVSPNKKSSFILKITPKGISLYRQLESIYQNIYI